MTKLETHHSVFWMENVRIIGANGVMDELAESYFHHPVSLWYFFPSFSFGNGMMGFISYHRKLSVLDRFCEL
jgi:hypothetical protein